MQCFPRRWLAGALLAVIALPVPALAEYPDRPIHLVVPLPAGSLTDVVARGLAVELQRELGQAIVVDNKVGAQGIVGTQAVTLSAPDGYTILIVGVTTAASNVSLFKQLPYDPRRDFTPIGYVAESPFILTTRLDLPVNTVGELYEYARKAPKPLTYGYGSGSSQVSGAKMATAGNIKVDAVPYRGQPQVLTDMMGGIIDLTFSDFANGIAMVRSGKLKAIGVTTRERFPLAPEIPTLAESGAPGYEIIVWFGMVGPANMPAPIRDRLALALNRALASKELKDRFAAQGLTAKTKTPDEFGAFIRSEVDFWAKAVKEAGIEPQ